MTRPPRQNRIFDVASVVVGGGVGDAYAGRGNKVRRGRPGLFTGHWRRPKPAGAGDTPGALLSAGWLAEWLLAGAVGRLPEGFRERYAEEWGEHRTHRSGWRLLWWAVCVRATAARTARELQHPRLPHLDR
jgi:hypothetical protein